MTTTQSWAGLPDHLKRQAAPDMLAGKAWMYFGNWIEHPGADELRRWVVIAPQSPQAGAAVANTRPRKPTTRQEKRDAVDLALLKNAELPDREHGRILGVSHTFIAMRRRKAGNVASASKKLDC